MAAVSTAWWSGPAGTRTCGRWDRQHRSHLSGTPAHTVVQQSATPPASRVKEGTKKKVNLHLIYITVKLQKKAGISLKVWYFGVNG